MTLTQSQTKKKNQQLTKYKELLRAIFLNLFKLSLKQPICYNRMHTEVPLLCLDGRVVIAS